jgi:hypothetical protein
MDELHEHTIAVLHKFSKNLRVRRVIYMGGLKSQCDVRELAPLVRINVIPLNQNSRAMSKEWTKKNFVC